MAQQNQERDRDRDRDSEDEGIQIRSFSKERQKLLVSKGVPGQDLIPSKFRSSVMDSLVKMEPNIPRVLPKPIPTGRQYKALVKILDHPLRSAYTIGIGSFPSDLRAKYLAQMVMSAAIDAHLKNRKPGRSMPLWHRVYGGLSDPLRDKPIQDMPCMLIISNVNESSSNYKLEKVRDLLEKFSDIPRIVITGGEPPCDLFANKLYLPLKAAFFLGPHNRIKEV